MTYLISLVIGIFLSIQLVAACYGIIDHGYRLQRYRWRVIGGLAGWGGIWIVLYWLLPESWEAGMVTGLKTILVIQVLYAVLGILLPHLPNLMSQKRYENLARQEGFDP